MATRRFLTRRQFVFGTAGVTALAISPTFVRNLWATAAGDLYATTTSLRLRSGPGLSYPTIEILPAGRDVQMIEWGPTADGYRWMKVNARVGEYADRLVAGYVASEFLRPLGLPPSDSTTYPAGTTVHVNIGSGGANLRSMPRLDSNVVRVIPNGTTGTSNGAESTGSGYAWLNVTMAGTTGWMATSLLAAGAGSITPPPSGGTFPIGSTVHVATASGVRANMRAGAGLSYAVVATFPSGTTGTVRSGETAADGYRWVRVTMGGTTGWMAAIVLAADAGSTTPPPAGDTTETFPIGATVHLDTTTGGNANLRSGPGLAYAVVKIVPNGTTATVLSGKTMADGLAWVKIAVLGVEGWIANGCLSAGAGTGTPVDADVRVADGPLNVRSEPGLTGAIITAVPTGASGVLVDGPQTVGDYTWVKGRFTTPATTGWVADAFLTYL